MTRRVCPICVLREAGVVSEDCAVCAGHGFIELGTKALKHYTAETVSTAIHLALEQKARSIHDTTVRSRDARLAIRQTLAQLMKAGLVADPKAPAPTGKHPAGTHTGPPARLAHAATGNTPTRVDQNMIRAHCFPYSDNDRPGTRGLPLFSNNWHPSSLACVLDPQPFETTTPKQARSRMSRNFQAKVLVEVATSM